MKKKRKYEDYRELGNILYVLNVALIAATIETQDMFGKTRPQALEFERLAKQFGELRAELDSHFCNEFPESAVPVGEPKFPVYPGPAWFRCPESLNDLIPTSGVLHEPDFEKTST